MRLVVEMHACKRTVWTGRWELSDGYLPNLDLKLRGLVELCCYSSAECLAREPCSGGSTGEVVCGWQREMSEGAYLE